MSVSHAIVGPGRVGLALARALHRAGRQVGLVARDDAGRRRAAQAAPGAVLLEPADLPGCGATTVVLCVTDDALPPLVDRLVSDRLTTADQLVVHVSGRYGLAVLAPLPGPVAAVHPAMTFPDHAVDLGVLPQVAYGVTADDAALPGALALVAELGGRPELVPDDRRALYHAALSHGANHLVTLVSDALDLLAEAGVGEPAGLLRPLVEAALANTLAPGPDGRPARDRALTGPVVRGDVGTLRAHLQALDGRPAVEPYRVLAARTAVRAGAAERLTADLVEAVLDAVSGG